MTDLNGFRRNTMEQRALDLLVYLQASGGASLNEVALALSWKRSQVRSAIDFARDFVCPSLGVTIPHPLPDTGFRYIVTGEWINKGGSPAIEAGTSYAMAQIESRLRTVCRDVKVAKANLDPRSIPGRKVNFLDKHLDHLLETLNDIGSSVSEKKKGVA